LRYSNWPLRPSFLSISYYIKSVLKIHKIFRYLKLGCQIPISFPKKKLLWEEKELKALIMSTKYGRYTNFYPSIGESKILDSRIGSSIQCTMCFVLLCHIVFLYDSCNIFTMCKIPPKTASRDACFQNSPTPSALLLCVKISTVL
jgi:hypothetical protein